MMRGRRRRARGGLSEKSSCDVIEVRAPALPAQRFLGGGFGRGAKPPSEFPGVYSQIVMSEPVTVEKFAVGQSVRRVEDPHLLQGLGRYSDDVSLPRQAYATVVRSPHAHARIRALDVAAARAAPGVLAVLTGADLAADGLGNLPT